MRIALLSSERWDGFLLSMRPLATAFAQLGHETLFVDPPVSPLSVVRQPERLRELLGRTASTDAAGDVEVWCPRVAPAQNSTPGQRFNARLMERGVRRRMPHPDLVVATSLESRRLVRDAGGVSVYWCLDSFEDLPGADGDAIRAREADMVAAVDRVAVCSLPLRRQLASRGVDAVYVPHGCDARFLASTDGLAVPAELRGRRRPFVGYVGAMNFRIDASLLDAALQATGGTLVLVGGATSASGPALDDRVRALLRRPDVVTVGHRRPDDLPAYIAAFDVAVVPYADTPFNRKSYPIKIPQYLAVGVPVVSTPNGATEELAASVSVAADAASFAAATVAAVTRRDEGRAARRAAAARRPWPAVASDFVRLHDDTVLARA